MSLINCPECGKEISDQAASCPNCGYEFKNEKRTQIKKLPVLLGIVVLIIIALFFVIRIIGNNSSKGYYDGNKWGSSREEIKNKYGENISESYLSSDALAMFLTKYNGIEGIDAMVQFEFDEDDGLNTVLLIIANTESQMSDSEAYDMIINSLTETYGESEEVDYGLSWETKESLIAAKQYPGSSEATMVIYNKKGE